MSKISKSNPVPLASRAAQAHPRQPSPRNVEVYGCVRLVGQTQEEVAARYGLTQVRVSQICAQVQEWREWVNVQPPHSPSHEERRRAARRLFRQRYEQIYAGVMRHLALNPHDRQLLKLAERMLSKLCELMELDSNHPPRGRTGPPDSASAGGPMAAAELPYITYMGSDLCSLPGEIAGGVSADATAVGDGTCGEPMDPPPGEYAALAAKKK